LIVISAHLQVRTALTDEGLLLGKGKLAAACVGENPSLRASMAEVVRVGSARWVAPNTGAERREGCARVERSVVGRHHLRKRSGAGNKQLRDEDVNTVTTMAHKGVEIGTDGTKGRL
jgi:hypothetical protein